MLKSSIAVLTKSHKRKEKGQESAEGKGRSCGAEAGEAEGQSQGV